ncbi:hypothetical protein J25TS5_30260 [Paenibacillus faecis]|nr:hypothetical protein J25TS5_30260 [Paenibacillus faecis]
MLHRDIGGDFAAGFSLFQDADHDFMADMQGVKDLSKRDGLIDRLQFDVRTPIRKMSKGMKQKVGIVAAFMHDPQVIILDELTSGLDPLMQKIFIELVLEEKARGTTFLMSSHSFPEIERTCDRAAIIKNGVIIAIKDIHELQSMQRKLFEVTFERPEDAKAFLTAGLWWNSGKASGFGSRLGRLRPVHGGDGEVPGAQYRYFYTEPGGHLHELL